ncbi:hypothetical protein [Persephonella sp.]|uniref:hypothetical protein n=1 Tax=Persephonella sp. TaxID=2060922 RepID=UPI00262A3C99|nr:hypothetical protein [Persephonella sp.]
MKRNWPFIIITGVGIFATLVFLYIFVYGLATRTVKSAVLIEKAYPHVKPQEYLNLLQRKAAANNLKIIQLRSDRGYFLIQIINDKKLDEVLSIAPQVAPLAIVNLVIYDLGDGTGIVGNNPYLWDIVVDSAKVDEIAESYSNELSDILDSIYWDYKKEQELLK